MNKKQSFFSIAFYLTGASILAKVLGFFRDILISSVYGLSDRTDAFYLAMSIPTMILGVFTSAADSAVIPQYNRILTTDKRERADKNFSNIINVLLLVGSIITVFIYFYPRDIIKICAPGFNQEQIQYSVFYLRIFGITGVLHMLYCFYSAYNTQYQNVVIRSILLIVTNLVVIIALLIYPDKQLLTMSLAYLFGGVISAILPIFTSYKLGYKHRWTLDIKNPDFIAFFKNFLPIMGVALIADLNLFVDKFLASNFGSGSVTALNYSSKLTMIFDGMIVIGLGVSILPYFSKLIIMGKEKQLNNTITIIINFLFIVLVPIVFFSIMNSDVIISCVYGRGSFTEENVRLVSYIFSIYGVQILTVPLETFLVRIFQCFENTRIPLFINIIGILINVLLSIILSKFIGLAGLAVGTSIATIFNVCFLYIYLTNKYKLVKPKKNIIMLVKISISLVIMYLLQINFGMYFYISNIWIKIIFKFLFTITIFIILLKLLRVKEINMAFEYMKEKIISHK